MDEILDVYRIYASNCKATLVKLAEEIYNFSAEIIDARQQFAEGDGFVIVMVKRTKKIVFFIVRLKKLKRK